MAHVPSSVASFDIGSKVVLYSKEIEKIALELCGEDKPFEIRRSLAAGLHQLLANKKNFQSFKRLDKLFEAFLFDSMLKESGVQEILSKNLATIIENYFAKLDVLDCTDRILVKRA